MLFLRIFWHSLQIRQLVHCIVFQNSIFRNENSHFFEVRCKIRKYITRWTRQDLTSKVALENSNHFAVCINFLMQMYIQLYFYGCIVYIIYSCCKLAIMWWWFLNLAWNKHVISEIAIIMWSKLGLCCVGCNLIFWANQHYERLVLREIVFR